MARFSFKSDSEAIFNKWADKIEAQVKKIQEAIAPAAPSRRWVRHANASNPGSDPVTWADLRGIILGSINIAPGATYNSTNNATVDSIDAGTGSATVRVHGPGSSTASWTRYLGLPNGAVGTETYASTSFTGKLYSTTYYVAFNPETTSYICTTTYNETLPDDYLWVGMCATVDPGGSGGSTGGGGNSGGGGGGGGGRLPLLEEVGL